jgi:arsenate reductase-like glutaredoxin family protein
MLNEFRQLLLCLLAFSALGCSTSLELKLRNRPDTRVKQELERLLEMLGLSARSVSETRARFTDVLDAEQQSIISRQLERMIGLNGTGAAPTLLLEVTESDPEVLEALDLKTDGKTPAFELELDPARGSAAMRSQRLGYSSQTICSYDIPTQNEVPALTYEVKIRSKGGGENPALAQLVQAINQLKGTAKHRISAKEKSLRTTQLEQVELFDKNELSFVFRREDEPYAPQPQYDVRNFLGVDYSRCHRSILSDADDVFFARYLFPALSTRLVSFSFDKSLF